MALEDTKAAVYSAHTAKEAAWLAVSLSTSANFDLAYEALKAAHKSYEAAYAASESYTQTTMSKESHDL